jgi:hypothetical protein
VSLEVAKQLAVVVDLAVENDPDGAVLIEDRLVTSGQVDDREPAHPQTDTVAEVVAVVVRAAMHHLVAHRLEQVARRRDAAPEGGDAGDPTHYRRTCSRRPTLASYTSRE